MPLNSLAKLWLGKVCAICLSGNEREICFDCESELAAKPVLFSRSLAIAPLNLSQSESSSAEMSQAETSQPEIVQISGLAIFDYDTLAAQVIHAFKMSGSKELATIFARSWVRQWRAFLIEQLGPDSKLVLAYAPSRARVTRQRGFVPAQLLAVALARELCKVGVHTAVSDSLWLAGQVQDQSQLSLESRHQNLKGKMRAKLSRDFLLSNATLAFVDDVVTTGATAVEGCRALAKAGKMPRFLFALAETQRKIARAK